MLASDKGFVEWGEIFGDEVIAAALIASSTIATSSTSAATVIGCGTTPNSVVRWGGFSPPSARSSKRAARPTSASEDLSAS